MNQMLSLKHHEPYRIFIESTKNIAEIFKTMIVYIFAVILRLFFGKSTCKFSNFTQSAN